MKRLPCLIMLFCLLSGAAFADPQTDYQQGQAALKAKEYGQAASFFHQAALENNVEAFHQLGRLYLDGRGVVKDAAEARRWFSRAAEQGHTEALYDMGLLYYQGIGVAENLHKAADYFREAGDKGYAPAQHLLGMIYAGNSADRQAESLKWFRLAAEQGHAASMNQLGLIYANGDGVKADLIEAYKWTLLAFEHGVSEAELLLVQLEADLTAGEIAEARKRAEGWQPRKAAGDEG